MRARQTACILGLAFVTSACAQLSTVVAPPDDLEDYRAFRVAAAEGTRLARAKRYLDRHPKGRFAAEVRAAFEEEEPRHFEEAQGSRELLRRYLADLPDGPHAEAALALLTAFGSSMKDAELRDLARKVRYEDAKLEAAAVQRRAASEAILSAVGILLDDAVYGVPRSEGPKQLRTLLVGSNETTWGAVPRRHEQDYFFILPTRPVRESRLLTLEIEVVEDGETVVGAILSASDLFVRWAEADQLVALDSSSEEDRTEAQVHAVGRLEGAFERRFPAATCPDLRKYRELYHRACQGWEVVVIPGTRAADKDVIILQSPRGRKAAPTPRSELAPPSR